MEPEQIPLDEKPLAPDDVKSDFKLVPDFFEVTNEDIMTFVHDLDYS